MPYSNREELPEQVRKPLRDVPHAQDIYRKAYNSAYEQYDENESRAHAVAWSAVNEQYEKDEDGIWRLKD